MKTITRFFAVCQALAGLSQICGSATLPVSDGDRIIFLGDSLTFHDGFPSYSDYMNAYLTTQNPSLTLHMQSLARSGLPIEGCLDTSPIGYQHYSKWVEPLAPKFVFIMFADNGGYTKAIDKQWMQILVSDYVIAKNHAAPVLLGMIPQASPNGYWPGGDYDDANEEIALAASPQLSYYKTWKALSPTWTSNVVFTADASTGLLTAASHGFTNGTRVLFQGGIAPAPLLAGTCYFVRDATTSTFRLSATSGGIAIGLTSNGSPTMSISANWARLRATSTDPVHPGPAASAIAAWKIITGLGWSTDVSSAVVDATSATVTSQKDCAITHVSANTFGGIDFSRLDAKLPWAIDEVGRADAIALYPAMANWQNYSLQVSGLAAGTYDVICNGETISTVASNTLAAGWNMSDLTIGPVWRQGQEVLGRIREMQGINRTTLWSIQGGARTGVEQYKSAATGAYDTNGLRGAALNAALAPFIANLGSLDSLIHVAAQPTTLSFSIRLHGSLPPNTATVTLGSLAQTYDGTAKAATATTSPAGLTVAFTYNGSAAAPTTAGTYTVIGTVNDANYTGSATGTLVIAKANATVTLGSLAQTYNGTTKAATATTSPAGLTVAFTYNGSATVPTTAGSYTLVGTVSNANYTGSATGTLVIAKANATVTLGSLAQIYDGTAKTATATSSPAGLTVAVTYNGSATVPTTAGSYTVVGAVSDPNYSGSATGTLVIAKANATVTLGSLAQTYDGTAKTATATTSPAGLTVAFTYNGSAATPTTASTYTVIGTVNDANYTGSATGTLVIAKANATVTLGSLAQTYDGTAKAATATTSPAGLSVAFTYNGSATAPTTVGSYAVVATVSDANYTGSATGTLVIASVIVKANATVTLGNLAQTYDGTAKTATATTSPAGLMVTFTYNGSPIAPTTAGSYTVVGSISDANYSGSASGTLVIAVAATSGYVPLGILGIPEPAFGIREQAPPPPAAWPAAAAAGSYYVDNTHPLATDTSNAYGYPNKPRLTIPTTLVVQAGTLVEIHGGPYLALTTAYAWRVISSSTNRPTAQAPAFIRGIGHPVIGVSQAAIDAGAAARIECGNVVGFGLHYTIFEGLHFVRMPLGIDGWDCQYIAVRNCEANGHYGVPISVNPPADKIVNGVTYQGHIHDIVFYNNLIHDTAYWNDTAKDWDYHGISVATFGRTYPTDLYNVWVLDSTFYHCSGDSVQVNGNTAGNTALHHIYIGRNTAWQNRQSGFWCKQASDVIMSQNTVHMMDVQGTGLTGTGMGSQYGADRLWFLFNHIYDCGYGFRQSDTTGADGRNVYYIGNYIHDLHQNSNVGHWGSPEGWGISLWSGSLNRHIVGNTIANVYGGIETIQAGSVDAQDNLIYNLKPNVYPGVFGAYRNHIECNATGNGAGVDYANCLLYGAVGGASQQARINWLGTPYTSLAAAQKALGKLANGIEADPLLMDAAKLGGKSPAIDKGAVSDVYQTFQDLYGIDIRRGFDGGPRPVGSGWDIGACEYSSATPSKPSYGGPVAP